MDQVASDKSDRQGPEAKTAAERQDALLMALGRRGTLASISILLGVIWVFQDSGVGWRFWFWAGALMCAAALRTVAAELALRATSSGAALWSRRAYVAGILGTALLWGLSTFLAGHQATYELNVFLCCVLAGVMGGAVSILAPRLGLYRLYLALLVVPVVLDFALRDEPVYHTMAVLALLGALVMEGVARSYHGALLESWRLGETNQDLALSLGVINARQARSNADLQREIAARLASEERFRSAFSEAPIGLALCEGGVLREGNYALHHMLEYAPDTLEGRTLMSLLSPTGSVAEQQRAERDLTATVARDYALATQAGNIRCVAISFAQQKSPHENGLPSLIAQFSDVTTARAMSTRLAYQASHDELTGLLNRREFEIRLEAALEDTRNTAAQHAVCYFDLDQFKVVNDTSGHATGDRLLCHIADTLGDVVRKTDTLARMGGDEFVLLMQQCSIEQAQRTALAIRQALEDLDFIDGEKRFRTTASLGLVPVVTGHETTAELLSAADAACFMAKELGRNRVHVYRAGDSDFLHRQGEMGWVERIDRAIVENRFELYFQTIEAAVRGPVASTRLHIELLLRMREVDGRLVPPGAFLPPAERYHVVSGIDRWVISRTLSWFKEVGAIDERLQTCGINLSGQSLISDDFQAFALAAMRSLGPLATLICFEITETSAIANLQAARCFIDNMRALGCRFALDDFGSGLSSFGYLRQLPVDYLKIDGMFVRDMLHDPVNLALVSAINGVGKTLGKITVAEFVENDAVRERLAELGVDCVQGYGVSLPQPITLLFGEA